MHNLLASPSVLRRDLERLQDYVINLREHALEIAYTLDEIIERDASDGDPDGLLPHVPAFTFPEVQQGVTVLSDAMGDRIAIKDDNE